MDDERPDDDPPGDERLGVYEAMGGLPAVVRLARAWHARCLEDPVAAHPFTHHPIHPRHGERLAAYWAEQLGGPALWTGGDAPLGTHEEVLRLHSGNSGDGEPHLDLDRRAVAAFVLALDDAGLPPDPRLRETLTDWFAWGTALMDSYPRSADDVPAGAPMPHWTWDGPA